MSYQLKQAQYELKMWTRIKIAATIALVTAIPMYPVMRYYMKEWYELWEWKWINDEGAAVVLSVYGILLIALNFIARCEERNSQLEVIKLEEKIIGGWVEKN